MALILITLGNRLGMIGVLAPFLVSGFLAYLVLARRTLTPAELELAARLPYVWLGLLSAWVGLGFWVGDYSTYYTSLLLPPTQNGCCLGYPSLQKGIALIPWFMLTSGTVTAVFAAMQWRMRWLFETASLGLLTTMFFTILSRPIYVTQTAYYVLAGWPLVWWGESFTTCSGCNYLAGTVLLVPFLLDWAFWSILAGGIAYIIRLRRKNQRLTSTSLHPMQS